MFRVKPKEGREKQKTRVNPLQLSIVLPASKTAELPVNMDDEHLIIEYLQRAGYESGYGEDGRIVAAHPAS